MDGHNPARRGLGEALIYWSDFIAKCISQRLDTDRFSEFVRLVFCKHPLPPVAIADFFLRPQPSNDISLDPRVPPYIQVLSQLGYIDAPSILKALHKYSSLHEQIQTPQNGHLEQEQVKESKRTPPTRWKSSSWAEEVMFYHVIKLLVEGTAFRDSRSALELVKITSKWMFLFASASNTFAADMLGELQDPQVRHEMDVSRAAFVPLLLRLVDNGPLVQAISKPLAKGTALTHTFRLALPFVNSHAYCHCDIQALERNYQTVSPLLYRLFNRSLSLSRN